MSAKDGDLPPSPEGALSGHASRTLDAFLRLGESSYAPACAGIVRLLQEVFTAYQSEHKARMHSHFNRLQVEQFGRDTYAQLETERKTSARLRARLEAQALTVTALEQALHEEREAGRPHAEVPAPPLHERLDVKARCRENGLTLTRLAVMASFSP